MTVNSNLTARVYPENVLTRGMFANMIYTMEICFGIWEGKKGWAPLFGWKPALIAYTFVCIKVVNSHEREI